MENADPIKTDPANIAANKTWEGIMDKRVDHLAYFNATSCDVEEFRQLVSQKLDAGIVPHAYKVVAGIPVYRVADLETVLAGRESRSRLMAEWAQVMRLHSGVLVLEEAYKDVTPIDRATQVYNRIIAEEKAASGGGADHLQLPAQTTGSGTHCRNSAWQPRCLRGLFCQSCHRCRL